MTSFADFTEQTWHIQTNMWRDAINVYLIPCNGALTTLTTLPYSMGNRLLCDGIGEREGGETNYTLLDR